MGPAKVGLASKLMERRTAASAGDRVLDMAAFLFDGVVLPEDAGFGLHLPKNSWFTAGYQFQACFNELSGRRYKAG